MPPKKSATPSGIHGPSEDDMEADQTELEDSQSAANNANGGLQQLVEDMVGAQRKRHTARKTAVHKAYTKTRADTEAAVTSLFDGHEKEAAQAHDAQLERLQFLMKQKVEVEKRMADKVASLRADYSANSKSLQSVLRYRAGELR
ncbi:hypothetical protein P280DRAFT_545670 [Massarina eburnea CBS 473.64]|uniref:Uncharacterized protein n=1 Tax=Massarina eburnea CBS 473.64 TaxID=1395130 RepID=A0A6A6SF99_9PLEO|nr:hypothetical protein P280DRAFT_545670 [Massarina eburnea CBS 473.64]